MTTTKSLFSAEGLDERSLAFLVNAMEENNLPGFDFLEFKRATVNLAEMKIDEATAYKSAFATASTMGLTKEKLIETAGYYRSIVEKEREQFSKALDNQNTTKVAAKQDEIKRLKDQVDRHKEDIVRLQDEIANYLESIKQAEEAVKLEAEKLDKAKTAFEKTHGAVLLQLDRDIENIHKLLGA